MANTTCNICTEYFFQTDDCALDDARHAVDGDTAAKARLLGRGLNAEGAASMIVEKHSPDQRPASVFLRMIRK